LKFSVAIETPDYATDLSSTGNGIMHRWAMLVKREDGGRAEWRAIFLIDFSAWLGITFGRDFSARFARSK
jgi:hypothetical protein